VGGSWEDLGRILGGHGTTRLLTRNYAQLKKSKSTTTDSHGHRQRSTLFQTKVHCSRTPAFDPLSHSTYGILSHSIHGIQLCWYTKEHGLAVEWYLPVFVRVRAEFHHICDSGKDSCLKSVREHYVKEINHYWVGCAVCPPTCSIVSRISSRRITILFTTRRRERYTSGEQAEIEMEEMNRCLSRAL
jgi:hypothetical protein